MRYVALTLCAAAMASAAVAPAVAVAPVLADEDSGGLAGLARGTWSATAAGFSGAAQPRSLAAVSRTGPAGSPAQRTAWLGASAGQEQADEGSVTRGERKRRNDFGRVEAYGLVLAGGALVVVGGLAIRRRRRRRSSDSTSG